MQLDSLNNGLHMCMLTALAGPSAPEPALRREALGARDERDKVCRFATVFKLTLLLHRRMRELSRMTPKLLRLVYAFEFLFALVAIFTAWCEIGGQTTLDLMSWGWKLGISLSLAASIVAFTAAIVSEDSFWTPRSARWLAVILVLLGGIGVVSYHYPLQVPTAEPEENGAVSLLFPGAAPDSLYV